MLEKTKLIALIISGYVSIVFILSALTFYIYSPLTISYSILSFIGFIISAIVALACLIFYLPNMFSRKKIRKAYNDLKGIVGENNISIKGYEKKLYSRDGAPLPSLVMMLFQTKPDIIIKSHDESALTQVLQYVKAKKIPLTLAAGKTSLMAGSVPIVGGIVIDLMENEGVIELDGTHLQVTVKAATVWEDLLNYLEFRGFTIGTYPSSSPAATVGGWISTAGIGIGSFKYGGISDQVIDMKILTLDGKIFHTNPTRVGTRVGYNLNMLGLGTEGTLGIVLEATLKIFPKPEVSSNHTITFDREENMLGFIDEIIHGDLTPHHIEWKDKHFVNRMRELGHELSEGDSLVFVALNGSNEIVRIEHEILQSLVQKWDGHDHGVEKSLQEWMDRFYPMRVKRLGPNIMGGETFIPTKSIGPALKRFERTGKSLNTIHGVEGAIGPRTSTTALCDVLVDERKTFSYLFSVGALIDVFDTGTKLEGRNYTFNAWNSFYMNRVYNAPHRTINKRIKAEFDSDRILQSYKTVNTPKTILGLRFRPFMFTAALNAIKLINNSYLIGGLLMGIGAFLALFVLFLPPGTFFNLYIFLFTGYTTMDGLLEPMINLQGLLVSMNLHYFVGTLLLVLDTKLFGMLSWLWFIGVVLAFVGALVVAKKHKYYLSLGVLWVLVVATIPILFIL